MRNVLMMGVALSCCATGAAAQNTDSDTESVFDEIVVTAQRREQTLAEVPLSVNVISGQDLDRQEIRNLDDLVQSMPSVNVVKTTNSSAFNLSIRGQGPAAQERGVEQSVGIYVDGVYRSRPVAGIADFMDIERVEVIKGPQSSIFGRNNSAGAFSIVTADPSDEFGGAYTFGYDNFRTLTTQATVTGPLLGDALTGRLSASYRRRDEGTIDNVIGSPEVGTFERLSLRGQVRAELGAETVLRVIADYSDLEDECCGFVPYFVPDTDVPLLGALGIEVVGLEDGREGFANGVPGRFIDLSERRLTTDSGYGEVIEDWGVQGDLEHDFGPLRLNVLAATRQTDSDVNFDIDGTGTVFAPILPFQSLPVSTFEETQLEVRFTSDTESPLQYLFGLYYFDQKIMDDNRLVQSTFDLIDVSTVTEAEAYAVFGQVSLAVTDKLTATVGLRYNDEEKTFAYSDIDPFGSFGIGPAASDTSVVQDDEVMGDASLNYAFDERTNAYLRYARGYKSPGANLLTFGVPDADFLRFDAETVDAYELGAKFVRSTVRGSAAVFYQETNDLQVQTINLDAPVPLLQVDNAAAVTALGAEFDLAWEPVEGLLLTGAVTYLDAEFDEYENASALAIGSDDLQDLSGSTPLQSPELAASASAQYAHEFPSGYSLTPRIDLIYKGDHFVTAASDPVFENDAYTLVNLSLDLSSPDADWTLSLYGRNVTDEVYLLTGTTFRLGFGGPSLTGLRAAINDPTTYGFALRAKF